MIENYYIFVTRLCPINLSSINHGDSTDNIPGCFGAGAAAATLEVNIIMKA
jgi:hypothetical protein